MVKTQALLIDSTTDGGEPIQADVTSTDGAVRIEIRRYAAGDRYSMALVLPEEAVRRAMDADDGR